MAAQSGMLGQRESAAGASGGRREGTVPDMAVFDILAPVLMIVAAIAVVALAYLAFTAFKDRSERKRDEELMNGYRGKRR